MEHNDIPNMLGRVLSGTKYGVRQTRGKFGLGSKMALIWSKQTTGLPIRAECPTWAELCVGVRIGYRHREERAERRQKRNQTRQNGTGRVVGDN